MYCIECQAENDGKFCPICGNQMVSSEKEWEHWKSRYANDSKAELEDKINHKEDYQEDAIASAAFLLRELEQHDKEEKQEKEIALSQSGIDLPKQDRIIPPPVKQAPGSANIVDANVVKLKNFKKRIGVPVWNAAIAG